MAKLIEALHLSQIFWLKEHNFARSASGYGGDPKQVAELAVLLHTGWNRDITPNPVVRLATADERKLAVERLESQWKDLRDQTADPISVRVGDQSVLVSTADQRAVFERLYVGKDGKVIVPDYTGVTCFRRANAMLLAQTIATRLGKPMSEELPVNVKTFTLADGKMDILSQIRANVEENRLKTAGSANMSNADLCGAARQMFQLGARESDLIKSLCNPNQRGLGQKLYAICKLDNAHPALGIVDGILSGDVEFGPLDKEKARKLVADNASDEQVAAFLDNPRVGNAKKIMARKDIERLGEQNPCSIVKLVVKAIIDDNPTALAGVTMHAAAINALVLQLTSPAAPAPAAVQPAPTEGAIVT